MQEKGKKSTNESEDSCMMSSMVKNHRRLILLVVRNLSARVRIEKIVAGCAIVFEWVVRHPSKIPWSLERIFFQ
jgi:hypothetical protein